MSIPSISHILGPIMVGPSSSHTAGAVRIGQEARNFLGEEPVSINITLYGSYAQGYRGHKTDLAVIGGCLGFDTGDIRIRNSGEEARIRGIKVVVGLDENLNYHTNTAVVNMVGVSGRKIRLRGASIGGGMIRIDEARRSTGTESRESDNLHINGLQDTAVDLDQDGIVEVAGFETCTELVNEAEKRGVRLSDLILEQEAAAWGKSQDEVKEMVAGYLKVMKDAVQNGLAGNIKSIGGLTDNDALRLNQAAQEGKLIGGLLFANAMSWAMAVNEMNASMGVVAAAPTGGACGVIPGAVLAAADALGCKDEDIISGLITAGGIGARIASKTSLSASVAGCQVEIGVAVGMGAAAIVQLSGGTPHQCAHAAALGIKSFIGLTCGALGGLCEVPCVKRNGIGAAAALAAANMALAGIKSQLPLDEVILGLADTGKRIPKELLGTTLTGLAGTPTGKSVYQRIYPQK
ncbi:MAG: L-serine ammonia-lyase, iron-sulfur-dependent, subunit alpha [Dehalobacterium sp.]